MNDSTAPLLDISRTVFLGDSITDGNTYQQLIVQGLKAAGIKPPHTVNAGIGGDTAAGMRARLDRDVYAYQPTLVTVSAGINDGYQGVPLDSYQTDMAYIADDIIARGIGLLLFTTTAVSYELAQVQDRIEGYNAFLRRFAAERQIPLADIYQPMLAGRDGGDDIFEPDGVHLSLPGYQVMTRAILDALGFQNVPVPADVVPDPLPGVVTPWKIRAHPDDEPIEPLPAHLRRAESDSDILALSLSDDGWHDLNLPCEELVAANVWLPGRWWAFHESRRGYAVKLDELAGKASRYYGVAEVKSDSKRDAILNTGASLMAVWLNGKNVYRFETFHGWHAGRDREPITLEAGVNKIVIESGADFFLSINDPADETLP